MNYIYLDYAATSMKHFDVYKEVIEELENIYANPSSNHSLGKKNKKLLDNAKSYIAESINANSKQIIFTSGGTEANNTVINHIKENFSKGEIIISSIEHSSIKESVYNLTKHNFKVIEIDVNSDGFISLDDLEKKITENTVLISVMYANNETGVIQPIKEITEIAKKNNILVHSDIVQAYCKTEIDIKSLNIDFASVSAHKIGATNNFGFLYSKEKKITPLLLGGGQEDGSRSGTSDVFGALVLKKCIEKTKKQNEKNIELKKYIINELKKNNITFEVNGNEEKSLTNILNLYFKNIDAQRLITYLDVNNIFISAGSACNSGIISGSKIIYEMYDEHRANHSVRVSIGFGVTKKTVDIFIQKVKQLEERIINRGK